MGIHALSRAIFLDRDGVLNANVLNPVTGQMESPHHPDDLHIVSGVYETLRRLMDAKYFLFLVSNQPSYAKGKTSLENIQAIASKFEEAMCLNGISFERYFYCLHHPEGSVPGYSCVCECRKPSPFFLQEAARDFKIDMLHSWMIGDRDTDIACGRNAGVRTIWVRPYPPHIQDISVDADFKVRSISDAASIVLKETVIGA